MSDERQDPAKPPGPGGDPRQEAAAGPRPARAPHAKGGRRGRATRPMHPDRPCMNCGDPTPGEYCPSCGQRKVDVQVSVRALFMEVLEDQFILDQRLPRTLGALLFKPGHLTVEHVNGRIARYIHPFRLYLVSSLIFFVLLSFFSLRLVRTAMIDGERGVVIAVEGDTAAVPDPAATPDTTIADTAVPDTVPPDTTGAGARMAADGETLAEAFGWDENPPTVSFGMAGVDSVMVGQIRRLGDMTPREAAETLAGTFLNYVPTMMFLLLPVFAGVLKLLYIRRRRYYAEHFVFLLHVHSMVFLVATVMLVLRSWLPELLDTLLVGWIIVYIFLAMKRVYGQGWLKTFAKFWTLGWMYFWLLLASVFVAFIATLALF